jgi:hypothetical protein
MREMTNMNRIIPKLRIAEYPLNEEFASETVKNYSRQS